MHPLEAGLSLLAPSISVRNVKLFMDGVITAPANTGALIEPYHENHGSAEAPRFEPAHRSIGQSIGHSIGGD
jgi:hypothetical protein